MALTVLDLSLGAELAALVADIFVYRRLEIVTLQKVEEQGGRHECRK